jgi:hypothetical protein
LASGQRRLRLWLWLRFSLRFGFWLRIELWLGRRLRLRFGLATFGQLLLELGDACGRRLVSFGQLLLELGDPCGRLLVDGGVVVSPPQPTRVAAATTPTVAGLSFIIGALSPRSAQVLGSPRARFAQCPRGGPRMTGVRLAAEVRTSASA